MKDWLLGKAGDRISLLPSAKSSPYEDNQDYVLKEPKPTSLKQNGAGNSDLQDMLLAVTKQTAKQT
jgi:hypothetical protein